MRVLCTSPAFATSFEFVILIVRRDATERYYLKNSNAFKYYESNHLLIRRNATVIKPTSNVVSELKINYNYRRAAQFQLESSVSNKVMFAMVYFKL